MSEQRLPGRDGLSRDLPRYRSHKEVWALTVVEVTPHGDGSATLVFADHEFAPLKVESKIVHRYMPIPGDYLVVYKDGYRSISPRIAFDEGYERRT